MSDKPDALIIFTVYFNPKDYPGKYVVRRFVISGPVPIPCPEPIAITDTLDSARAAVPRYEIGQGVLIPWDRSPDDDPTIIESWM